MEKSPIKLILHHHHTAYQDDRGQLWLSSVLGRWVNAIADNISEVRLLLFQTQSRMPQQDTLIDRSNALLYSLGPPKRFRQRQKRSRSIQSASAAASQGASGLLIRGVTPRQYAVWQAAQVQNKGFLLVGSLYGDKLLPWSARNMLPKIIAYQRRREMKSMAARGTLLLANSPVLAAEMETLYHQKAQFIPTNSIRRSEFSPFQIRPLSAPWKLLYCGRLDLKKGLQELFQALAILNAGGHACQLDMVGAIDSEVYPYLSSLAKRLEIDPMVRWHGLIPYGDQLFQFYRRADALILPSYTEGFPHAIWEAAGNCCPIVTTDAGGIPALLEHDSHALLIRTHDIDAIAGALLRLFSDELLRRRIITNAYNHALQFSAEACAIKLVSVLEAEWN